MYPRLCAHTRSCNKLNNSLQTGVAEMCASGCNKHAAVQRRVPHQSDGKRQQQQAQATGGRKAAVYCARGGRQADEGRRARHCGAPILRRYAAIDIWNKYERLPGRRKRGGRPEVRQVRGHVALHLREHSDTGNAQAGVIERGENLAPKMQQ